MISNFKAFAATAAVIVAVIVAGLAQPLAAQDREEI